MGHPSRELHARCQPIPRVGSELHPAAPCIPQGRRGKDRAACDSRLHELGGPVSRAGERRCVGARQSSRRDAPWRTVIGGRGVRPWHGSCSRIRLERGMAGRRPTRARRWAPGSTAAGPREARSQVGARRRRGGVAHDRLEPRIGASGPARVAGAGAPGAPRPDGGRAAGLLRGGAARRAREALPGPGGLRGALRRVPRRVRGAGAPRARAPFSPLIVSRWRGATAPPRTTAPWRPARASGALPSPSPPAAA